MKESFLPYNKNLRQISRNLRNNSTLAEVLLWNELKAGKMRGYKFNKQKPILNFVVDFYCKKLCLVIEIDGESHGEKIEEDVERQMKLEALGLTVLRVDDLEVKFHLEIVLEKIEMFIDEFEGCSERKSP